MLDTLKRLFRGAPEESDTDRDGFLSYGGEYHAMTIGVYRGLTTLHPWRDDPPSETYDDVAAEPWYYRGGFVIGTLLQVIVLAVLWTVFGGIPGV